MAADRARAEAEAEAERLSAVMADGQAFIGWPADEGLANERNESDDVDGTHFRTPAEVASEEHRDHRGLP